MWTSSGHWSEGNNEVVICDRLRTVCKPHRGGPQRREPKLTGADLTAAEIEIASMKDTVVANVDLSAVKGLETVRHLVPSTIGIVLWCGQKARFRSCFCQGRACPNLFIV